MSAATTLYLPTLRTSGGISTRESVGTAILDQRLYIFGGNVGNQAASNELFSVNTNDKTVAPIRSNSSEVPRPNNQPLMLAISPTQFVVFGGNEDTGSKKRFTDDFFVFDTNTTEWTNLAKRVAGTMPPHRNRPSIAVSPDAKIYLFGGSTEDKDRGTFDYLNDLHVLDLPTMRWSVLMENATVGVDIPNPVTGCHAAIVGPYPVIHGGLSGTAGQWLAMDKRFYFFDTNSTQ
ncbi:hypothetical protein HDV00_008154 [Rhizophlyctis rosea]|nr:hypothetical protein HDV00_008154 [Rhizophlyctis rosea]